MEDEKLEIQQEITSFRGYDIEGSLPESIERLTNFKNWYKKITLFLNSV